MSDVTDPTPDPVEAAARVCDERTNGPRSGNTYTLLYWRHMMREVLDAVGYTALVAERDRLRALAHYLDVALGDGLRYDQMDTAIRLLREWREITHTEMVERGCRCLSYFKRVGYHAPQCPLAALSDEGEMT